MKAEKLNKGDKYGHLVGTHSASSNLMFGARPERGIVHWKGKMATREAPAPSVLGGDTQMLPESTEILE